MAKIMGQAAMIAALEKHLKEKAGSIVNRKRPGIPLVAAGLGGSSKITVTGPSPTKQEI